MTEYAASVGAEPMFGILAPLFQPLSDPRRVATFRELPAIGLAAKPIAAVVSKRDAP